MVAQASSKLCPVVFPGSPSDVEAGFSLLDRDEPQSYSMRRPARDEKVNPVAAANMTDFAATAGFPLEDWVITRKYPHASLALIVTNIDVVPDERTGTLNPYLPKAEIPGYEDSADALVTTSHEVILGSHGADCPVVYVYDPERRVIGIMHCGWRSTARNIVANTITVFKALGSHPSDILAFVGPGAGDNHFEFHDDATTHPVFAEQSRLWVFDQYLRPSPVAPSTTILAHSELVRDDLYRAGLSWPNVDVDWRSSQMEPTLHSYRRDGTGDPSTSNHGLGVGYIRLV